MSTSFSCQKYIQGLSQIWDRSLFNDFAKVLCDNKKDVYKVVSGVNLGLCGPFEDYMAVGNLELLLGGSTSFRGVLGRGDFRPPNLYIVRDVFEREHPKFIVPSDRNPNDCAAELERFRRETLNCIHL